MLSDPAIKLFGKTIPLPESSPGSVNNSLDAPSRSRSCSSSSERIDDEVDKIADFQDDFGGKISETEQKDEAPPLKSGDFVRADETTEMNEDPEASSIENKTAVSSTITEEEKELKKPDKILPCPRCSSMDTKFCYFNNYNVNQPRHFCRKCQRYWTSGGTMRNVPVGAGRRKNKNSGSHYRQITVSEALRHAAQKDVENGINQPPQRRNETVLTFISDAPLCESVASVLNITEKISKSGRNGIHQQEDLKILGPGGREGSEHVSGSSDQDSSQNNNQAQVGVQEHLMQNFPCIPPIPCYPGAHWPYPWNPMMSPPGFCPPGFPMPFYPAAAYWGCPLPGAWNVPWGFQPSVSSHTTQNSGPDSPTLGKHSRDESVPKSIDCADDDQAKENSSERNLWIPKTLRIDDPGEAAKSSIWSTLGIKNDKAGSFSGRGLFRAFQTEVDENGHSTKSSPLLQANPAALSRSVNFREKM